jgi:AAA+ ATPase superfamily predicted ATPase
MEQFVDRDAELDQLTACYDFETADFVVIYGRRRLGKSELVRQSIADRDDAAYYQAVESRFRTSALGHTSRAATRRESC